MYRLHANDSQVSTSNPIHNSDYHTCILPGSQYFHLHAVDQAAKWKCWLPGRLQAWLSSLSDTFLLYGFFYLQFFKDLKLYKKGVTRR